jgi:hypothetical protein
MSWNGWLKHRNRTAVAVCTELSLLVHPFFMYFYSGLWCFLPWIHIVGIALLEVVCLLLERKNITHDWTIMALYDVHENQFPQTGSWSFLIESPHELQGLSVPGSIVFARKNDVLLCKISLMQLFLIELNVFYVVLLDFV